MRRHRFNAGGYHAPPAPPTRGDAASAEELLTRAAAAVSGLALLLALAPPVRGNEPTRVRPVRVGFGLPMPLRMVDEGAITVRTPPTQTGGGEEMTLAIDKEKTRFSSAS